MRKILLIALLANSPLYVMAQVVINEICATNADIIPDPENNNFSPWIELFNPSSSVVNIGGYYLSDNILQKTKWQIPIGTIVPAKGYLLIWCDNLNEGIHTNFSLDSEGEQIILSTSNQALVDRLDFPKQYVNVSFGRVYPKLISYLVEPTPGSINNSATGTTRLESPQFSVKAGRYQGSQTLALSHSEAGVEIRYTLDGSEPTKSSLLYAAPITISETKTVKTKAFKTNFIPGQTEAATYFINEHPFSLPVISITTKPNYLWNNTLGIYTDGTNGITGNCKDTPVNWNQDWDRHATIESFDAGGKRKFYQDVDIRIAGACSRNNPQKSLAIKARSKYGSNVIDEKLFSTKPSEEYGGFMLRNSGNDFNVTMFRDAFMQTLTVGQMDVDYMAYQPTIFYLNGQYWGIQNMREKIDADYIESNYGIKKDDIDLIESWGFAIEGSADAYNTYLSTLSTLNPTDPSTYQFIDQHIDVQEYINYITTEIYYANTDWPGNNVKFWRQRSTNGKFRWILWDTDFGFALYTGASYATHPTLNFATDPNSGVGWPNPPWSTAHLRLLLQNPEFKSRFIQTLCTTINTTFNPERVNRVIDDFQNRIKAEMPFHKQRWGGTIADWNFEVQRLRDFSIARNQFMRQHMVDFFGFNQTIKLSASSSPASTGSVKLNGVVLNELLVDSEYFRDLNYQVEALTLPGYRFKEWQIQKREVISTTAIQQGSVWRYFDSGSLPAAVWVDTNFSDAPWLSGSAQLGYGDGDETTIVSYGSDANNKFITTYLRKEFVVADASSIDGLRARVLFDDGVVVYLNGTEVFRNNLQTGTINYSTLASQAIENTNEFASFTIPNNLLANGKNVIAVEIHQVSPQSSDISFDFSLTMDQYGAEQVITDSNKIVTGVADSNISVEAIFEIATPITGLVINEVSAANTAFVDEFNEADDWIELYNASSEPIDIGNLYVTDNLNAKLKHLILPGAGKTQIAPNQYKILWADKQVGQGPLHLNFKLSADEEAVGIYQQIGGDVFKLDEVAFQDQYAGVTFSRIPNGNGPFINTSQPTPGESNIFEVIAGIENDFGGVDIFPNPAEEIVYVKASTPLPKILVYNSVGVLVSTYSSTESTTAISVSGFQPGLYLFRILREDHYLTKRLIVK